MYHNKGVAELWDLGLCSASDTVYISEILLSNKKLNENNGIWKIIQIFCVTINTGFLVNIFGKTKCQSQDNGWSYEIKQ